MHRPARPGEAGDGLRRHGEIEVLAQGQDHRLIEQHLLHVAQSAAPLRRVLDRGSLVEAR